MEQTFFSINKNFFFAQSENLTLSLLVDEDYDIRIKGLEIFKLAAESCPNLRKFELPKVNFAAENLIERYFCVVYTSITEGHVSKSN